MNSITRIVCTLGALALALGGCVAQDKYDTLADTNQTSAARLEQLNQENKQLASGMDAKQRRIDELEGETRQLRSVNDDLNGQIGGVRGKMNQLVDEFGNIKFTMLDPATDQALVALAAQYPDLIKYDSARGLVQFMSDLTFDSGSDVVKSQAQTGLQRLAQILQGSSASNYDVRIVGHTDNVPVSRTSGKWGDNRGLGFFRARAVENTLRGSGVPGYRMETSSWGEHRPSVTNNDRGGTVQNRRVEIYIVPSSGGSNVPRGSADMAPSRPAAQPARQNRDEMPMK